MFSTSIVSMNQTYIYSPAPVICALSDVKSNVIFNTSMNSGSLPFCLRTPYTWRFYCYAHDVDWPPHPLDSPAQVPSRFVYVGLMLLLQPVEISTGRTGCEQTESGTEGRSGSHGRTWSK